MKKYISQDPGFILKLVIVLILAVLFQTYMLRDSSERLRTQETDIRKKVFQDFSVEK